MQRTVTGDATACVVLRTGCAACCNVYGLRFKYGRTRLVDLDDPVGFKIS